MQVCDVCKESQENKFEYGLALYKKQDGLILVEDDRDLCFKCARAALKILEKEITDDNST
jgi:hypothetical protein